MLLFRHYCIIFAKAIIQREVTKKNVDELLSYILTELLGLVTHFPLGPEIDAAWLLQIFIMHCQ